MENQDFISIQEAMDKDSGEVSIRGWVYRERKSNKFVFIVLRDSSNIIQCVIKKGSVTDEIFEEASKFIVSAGTSNKQT